MEKKSSRRDMAMSDYTQIEDFDCPQCPWSLHIEKRVWNEIDDHSLVINYIETMVRDHNKIHGNKAVSRDLKDYITPYVTHTSGSALTILNIE
jgi:hypothetical protein